jgi:hypothetical protein
MHRMITIYSKYTYYVSSLTIIEEVLSIRQLQFLPKEG